MNGDFRLKVKTESFNFKETILSHGWVFLKPFYWDDKKSELTLKTKVGISKRVELVIGNKNGSLTIKGKSFHGSLNLHEKNEVKNIVRHVFRLDEDFSEFYELCKKDLRLRFVNTIKSGRLLRSPTVFEDIIKTICTTNCSWSNTKLMVANMCDLANGCFPSPKTILNAGVKRRTRKN
jgi:3-methyladenine DNA glycosylase/8-oxoguanine DNA glycosylase